jgi:Zn finger protein HypA/HybF involved in hydrogenase expression
MEIEGCCHACGHKFNAHWHTTRTVGRLFPLCPACKSSHVHILTDETLEHESPRGDDYEEADGC